MCCCLHIKTVLFTSSPTTSSVHTEVRADSPSYRDPKLCASQIVNQGKPKTIAIREQRKIKQYIYIYIFDNFRSQGSQKKNATTVPLYCSGRSKKLRYAVFRRKLFFCFFSVTGLLHPPTLSQNLRNANFFFRVFFLLQTNLSCIPGPCVCTSGHAFSLTQNKYLPLTRQRVPKVITLGKKMILHPLKLHVYTRTTTDPPL